MSTQTSADRLPWWCVTVRLASGAEFGMGRNFGTGRPSFWKYIPPKRLS